MGPLPLNIDLRLREILIKHEELRLKPYVDCCAKSWRDCTCLNKGKLTIGVGRNLEDVGISGIEAMHMLSNDMERVAKEVLAFPWFKSISVVRQNVVLSMIFNMGMTRFSGFKKMIAALSAADFNRAADEMLSSAWASQVGVRAKELAAMMRSNLYDPPL